MYTIYSKPSCPQCVSAKALLASKHLPYQELVLDVGQDKVEGVTYYTVQELKAKVPTAQSVPQIFIEGQLDSNEIYIGGFAALQKYLAS